MKKNKIFTILVLLLVALNFNSCQSTVDGLNDDPNNSTTVTTDLLLRQAMLNTSSIAESDPARFAGMFTDQFRGGSRQYRTYNGYGVVAATYNNMWRYFTARGSAQAKLAAESAKKEGNKTKEILASLFESYYFAEEALLWGDIPYSEANQDEQFPDPKFDNQKEVLQKVISKLEALVPELSNVTVSSNAFVQSTTLIFGSANNANWGQIANSLIARYYLALKDYSKALAAAKKGIATANQSLEIQHTSANFSENLFYIFQVEQRTNYLRFNNSYFQKLLTADSDVYRGNSKTDETNRLKYYVSGVDLNTGAGGAFDKSASFPVISYFETLLTKAELEARADNMTEAIKHLNEARKAWNTKLKVNSYQDYVEADFASGGIANTQSESKKDALLREILEEKYLSVIGLPTFYDVNRTNNFLKVTIKGRSGDGKKMIPQRFIYPANEAASNSNFPGSVSQYTKTEVNK